MPFRAFRRRANRLVLALATLAVLPITGGLAEAAMWDVWELRQPAFSCRLSFDQEQPIAAGVYAVVRHSSRCQELTGWSTTNNGNSIMLYSTHSGLTVIGRVDREADGSYRGIIGDGTPVSVIYKGQMEVSPAPTAPIPPRPGYPQGQGQQQSQGQGAGDVFGGLFGGIFNQGGRPGGGQGGGYGGGQPHRGGGSAGLPQASSEAQVCTRYYGSNRCAEGWDTGEPPFSGGASSIETLAKMNVRFLPGSNSNIIGEVERGVCLTVSRCRVHFDKALWCETRHGNFSGWVLKQDANYVYSRNGCG